MALPLMGPGLLRAVQDRQVWMDADGWWLFVLGDRLTEMQVNYLTDPPLAEADPGQTAHLTEDGVQALAGGDLRRFAERVVALNDPPGSVGWKERRLVMLADIIDWARRALAAAAADAGAARRAALLAGAVEAHDVLADLFDRLAAQAPGEPSSLYAGKARDLIISERAALTLNPPPDLTGISGDEATVFDVLRIAGWADDRKEGSRGFMWVTAAQIVAAVVARQRDGDDAGGHG